jgi:hypothetical protein
MSNLGWFIYAVVCALTSVVGLAVAVGLRERGVAVVAVLAALAFSGAAAFFAWALWWR